MTVTELIELLNTCDPKALVVVNEEPMFVDDRNIMQGAMQAVDALEVGWSDEEIVSDMTFSMRPIGNYLVPAVRIMGGNHEPTDPNRDHTINGVGPMKDVEIQPIKRLPPR